MTARFDESDTRRRPRDYLYRAGAAYVRAHVTGKLPERCAKEMFGDPVTDLIIQRAASAAATIGAPSWAGALAEAVVDDSIMAVATLSAAAGLIQRGMKLDFGRRASIRVPGRILDASDAGQWTAEERPAVMRVQRMTSGPTLTPHKLIVLTSYTREMAEQSAIASGAMWPSLASRSAWAANLATRRDAAARRACACYSCRQPWPSYTWLGVRPWPGRSNHAPAGRSTIASDRAIEAAAANYSPFKN